MGACLILTPIIIASWPAVTAAVTAAVSSMGFSVLQNAGTQQARTSASTRVDMEVDDSEILKGSGATNEHVVVERDGVRAVFSRDARGALKLCMEAKGRSEAELHQLGDELIGRVRQQYVYHRIMSELKARNMTVVDEQVTANRTVKVRVRSV